MGKVRVKTFGSQEQEEQEKKKTKEKREAKKMAKAPGLKGGADEQSDGARPALAGRGQRVVAVEPGEEELRKTLENQQQTGSSSQQKKRRKSREARSGSARQRSARYQASIQALDKTKIYSVSDALDLLAKFQKAKFDETVELHLNTVKTGVSASLTLPHGTGKKTRVAVADDKIISEIEAGKINFDILIATPQMMPQLAKVAKVLGPKGLMPNPKNGTIAQNPQELIKKYEAGQVSFKTEAKAPLIHLSVGKISFGEKKLKENIDAILQAVKPENIQKIVLKTTMSPGIKLQIGSS